MATKPASGPAISVSERVREFCGARYAATRAAEFGITVEELEQMVGAVATDEEALRILKLDELVLARACERGCDAAWQQFMAEHREVLYGAAYKIAGEETKGRELADSLYAELYASKLRSYSGRGSLAGWLRTVLAQMWVNQFRKTKRETSFEELSEGGREFAARGSAVSVVDGRVARATERALKTLDVDERLMLVA